MTGTVNHLTSTTDLQRTLAFFMVCIPVRIGIATLVGVICDAPSWVKHCVAGFLGYVALGFIGQVFRDPEYGGFGGRVWWRRNRYVHIILYLTSVVLLYVSCSHAWIPLAFDVGFAFVSGVYEKCRLTRF